MSKLSKTRTDAADSVCCELSGAGDSGLRPFCPLDGAFPHICVFIPHNWPFVGFPRCFSAFCDEIQKVLKITVSRTRERLGIQAAFDN